MKTKRIITAACAFALALSMAYAPLAETGIKSGFGITASAEDKKYGYLNYISDGTQIYITGLNDFSTTVIQIPDTIEKLPVTTIEDYAFAKSKTGSQTNIRRVVLGKNVTGIGERAFFAQSKLNSITVNDALKKVGDSAFRSTGLKEVDFKEGLTTLNASAFQDCVDLEKITIPSTVTEIYEFCFSGCKSLKMLDIQGNLTYLGAEVCTNDTALTEVKIAGVAEVKQYSFKGCSSLVSVQLPDNLNRIYGEAFGGCTSLKTINLPEGLATVDAYVFTNCTSLLRLDVPKSLTSFGNMWYGYATTSSGSKINDAVMGVCRRSAAQTYAMDKGFNYVYLDMVYGDITNDGKVDSKDAMKSVAFAKKTVKAQYVDETDAADVNFDGKLDSKDALTIINAVKNKKPIQVKN